MRVLVTRPEEDGRTFAAALEALGHTTVLAPMSGIAATGDLVPVPTDLQASIATSRNAIRHLPEGALQGSDGATLRSAPHFAVGRTTAEAARARGFQNVIEGPGTAQTLMPVILAQCAPAAGPVLHLAGDPLALDVAAELRGAGYDATRITVYRARPAEQLPDTAVAALANGEIDTVVMLSPLAVRTYLSLVRSAGLWEAARRVQYACLSQGVADTLSPLQPIDSKVSRQPNSQELLALFG